ncbi:heavy metal-binding domain-containing protein [Bacillus massiliigorillae]|uniref:heavy metal-binding domain-containing protein n=1 Tax=Bacillus massiliigorillae TaxID=1243664 RepID=UPI00039F5C73|nr:heavy metal-binding domain-containing protein [Bacillus massiliigorillae]
MIIATTPTLEGYKITEYRGVGTAQAIMGANIGRDFLAGLTDIFGGRSGQYEGKIEEASNTALEELKVKAKAKGANAIVGIDFDFGTVGSSESMMLCVVSGTFVMVEKQ